MSGAQFARLVADLEGRTGGRIGVFAQSLDGGHVLSVQGDERFPLASTYKVAIAAAVLGSVERGELSLSELISITPERYVPEGVIASSLPHAGVALSVANLVELMLTWSDNTATDELLRLAGGPAAVMGALRRHSFHALSIDRPTAALIRQFYGLGEEGSLVDAFEAQFVNVDPVARTAAAHTAQPRFDDDPRDHGTPRDLVRLWVAIARHVIVQPASARFLLGVMERCRTGENRIRALLPPEVQVANKTGTIGGTVNDSALLTLPGGRQIALAILSKSMTAPFADRERAVAEIARKVHDLFGSPPV